MSDSVKDGIGLLNDLLKPIEVLIPIPFLDDKIADWFAGNVPNPNGRWHGLVGKVE